jgi:hypothetical protein
MFRKQPWTTENFDAMVDASSYPRKSLVKESVHEFAIFSSHLHRIRAVRTLLESMNDYKFLQKKCVKQFVGVVISSVAESYVASSTLVKLTLPKDKWEGAKQVFLAVDGATRNPTKPFILKFEELEAATLRSTASSVI